MNKEDNNQDNISLSENIINKLLVSYINYSIYYIDRSIGVHNHTTKYYHLNISKKISVKNITSASSTWRYQNNITNISTIILILAPKKDSICFSRSIGSDSMSGSTNSIFNQANDGYNEVGNCSICKVSQRSQNQQ
ncbi:hypothetical protein ACTFIV_005692 [Dictyostelium citrinum]